MTPVRRLELMGRYMLWFPRFVAEPSAEEIRRHAELVRW